MFTYGELLTNLARILIFSIAGDLEIDRSVSGELFAVRAERFAV